MTQAIVMPPQPGYGTNVVYMPRQLDEEELAQWVREKSDPACGKDQCVLFTLAHDSDHGPVAITQEPLPKGASDKARRIERLVNAFAKASRNTADSAGTSRPQRFMVGGHVRDNKDEHALFQYVFLVTPPPESLQREDQEGSVSAMMGHLGRLADMCVKQLASNLQQNMDRMVVEKSELYERVRKLESDRWEMMVKCEQLLDNRALRDVQTMRERLDLDFQHKLNVTMAEFGSKFGMRLLAKWLNMPEEERSNPMLEFVKTLEPKQLLAFVGNLTDAQRAAFEPMFPAVVSAMSPEKQAALALAMQEASEEKRS